MSPEYGQKEKNISTIYSLAEKAFRNGADIVVAPEMATDHYYFDIEDVSDNIFIQDESKEFAALIELAGRYDGYICLGYPEKDPSRTFYNSAVVLGKDGVVAKHRKRTLPGWNSSGNLELPVFNSRFGKIGVLICADTNDGTNYLAELLYFQERDTDKRAIQLGVGFRKDGFSVRLAADL